jgi:hypothetical protein
MVECFAEVVSGESALPYLPEDSVLNMKVIDALVLAAQTGRTIDL